jgi:hypothetical protein
MTNHIILHMDENFFMRMKEDKLRREKQNKQTFTWEEYIKLLFGMARK